MLYFITKKNDNVNDTAQISIVYGSAEIITTIRNWFKRFRTGNFDLKN